MGGLSTGVGMKKEKTSLIDFRVLRYVVTRDTFRAGVWAMATTLALHKHLAETQKDERLLAVVYVKSIKRGPHQGHKSLLCLTINNKTDAVTLQKLKVQQNDSFATRQRWSLTDLKHVDALDGPDVPNPTNRQFVLSFEKPMRWQAFSVKEKDAFLFVLWRSCGRYLRVSPPFENFDTQAFTGEAAEEEHESYPGDDRRTAVQSPGGVSLSLGADDKEGEDAVDDKELTAQQEQDINAVLANRDWSQNDAEEYSTRLAEALRGLENDNVLAVLASDRKAAMLIKDIDHAIKALDSVEEQVNKFDGVIFDVRTDVTEVDEQVKVVDAQATNEAALIVELQGFLAHLDFPPEYHDSLLRGDLSNTMVLDTCVDAVNILRKKRAANLSPGLAEMTAAKSARKDIAGLEKGFTVKFEQFFVRYLDDQMKQMGSNIVHETRRRRLEPYAPLMQWLKESEPPSRMSRHMGLCRSYASALCPVYLEELRDSCERCKSVCAVKGKGNSSRRDLQTRLQFDAAFGELLGEVIPPRLAEQEFCANFFMSTETTTAPVVDESQTETRRRRMQTTSGAHREIENLVEIFQGLDTELVELISTIEKVDPFFSVVAMARVHTIMPYPNTMIATYLKNIRAAVMTKFDAFVAGWIKNVRETKVPQKKKLGILQINEQFTATIEAMEKVMERTEGAARSVIDDAMVEMAHAVLETILRIADDVKYKNVVIFENCHILKDRLSTLKIECLKPFKKTIGEKYNIALNAFVKAILGRPMPHLSAFFEEVESLIESGTPAREVSFKSDYNKSKLREVIAKYPGKEVKKGLDAMYKKVDKHLSDDAYLLDVVWRNLQAEFVKQYHRFDELIAQCYPGEKVSLEFDEKKLLEYFMSTTRAT
eukprot:m.65206 g.65206  ORF g.65206 m.65206 type:complete len:879 (-) comp9747_c0_seq2:2106-4742(-)